MPQQTKYEIIKEALLERIEETYPDLEIDAHRGEQPLYPVVLSLE